MDPINDIQVVPRLGVNDVGIRYIPSWQIRHPFVPNFNPVTSYIGFPIIDMPGCVEMHKDNKRHVNGVPIDKGLVLQDPD